MSKSKDAWARQWDYPIGYGQHELPVEAYAPLISRAKSYEVIVLDTETTGTGDTDRVIEIAAARISMPSGEVLEKKSTLIDPKRPIPREATEVHHITDSMVRGKPVAKDVLPSLAEFVGNLPIVCHNAPFDMRMLRREFTLAGIARPCWSFYCSMRVAKAMDGTPTIFENLRLDTLVQCLGVQRKPSHRALGDVMALIGVIMALNGLGQAGSFFEKHGPAYLF
jgi:DNA polymerase-3 subunit epsilon